MDGLFNNINKDPVNEFNISLDFGTIPEGAKYSLMQQTRFGAYDITYYQGIQFIKHGQNILDIVFNREGYTTLKTTLSRGDALILFKNYLRGAGVSLKSTSFSGIVKIPKLDVPSLCELLDDNGFRKFSEKRGTNLYEAETTDASDGNSWKSLYSSEPYQVINDLGVYNIFYRYTPFDINQAQGRAMQNSFSSSDWDIMSLCTLAFYIPLNRYEEAKHSVKKGKLTIGNRETTNFPDYEGLTELFIGSFNPEEVFNEYRMGYHVQADLIPTWKRLFNPYHDDSRYSKIRFNKDHAFYQSFKKYNIVLRFIFRPTILNNEAMFGGKIN